MTKGMTISEAAHSWVNEMNTYPQDMIRILMDAKPNDWHEVTVPCIGKRVYVYELPEETPDGKPYESTEHWGTIEDYFDHDTYQISMNDGESILVKADNFEMAFDDRLPTWGWMWSFGDSADDYWLSDMDGIRVMSECGFKIYENDEWGYFFGIDGAGYDFYTEHWIPLYKKRGLQWHDPTTEYTSSKITKILKRFIEDKEIVEKLVKLKANQTEKIGGYHGGFLSSTQIQKLTETGLFEAKHKHEKVQEMHGEEDNNYYVVRRI